MEPLVMENIILFDGEVRKALLPFTWTRPVAELRLGILTIREKWERTLGGKASYITEEYLSDKYPISMGEDNFIINAAVLPTPQLVARIRELNVNEAYVYADELVAARIDRNQFDRLLEEEDVEELASYELEGVELLQLRHLWDIFLLNDRALRLDFELLTQGRQSAPLSPTNVVIGQGPIFVEEGATVEGATLNAMGGPIYIGPEALVMEGALLRGSVAICAHAVVKMGAKVYGGTTIGPWCKVGGEVQNVVFFGYSNKGHEGYLGNSVVGEWCNFGADTNCSNLKNDYSEVKLWSYEKEGFVPTAQQFCGLFMGDHSKCGINTMFNTGTVVGVSANIFGAGYPRNFIPSFAWGGPAGWSTYRFDKALATAERVMQRRGVALTPDDRLILMKVFEESARFRYWEKGT